MAKRSIKITDDRLEKLQTLIDLGINPYPAKVIFDLEKVEDARKKEGSQTSVAGRILGWRVHGEIIFGDLADQTGEIQVWFQKKLLGKEFEIVKLFDIGDFLAVKGEVVKTKSGELTVNVSKFQFLSKALKPLPNEWHGFKDVEERFRKRYLDLLLNPEVKKRFLIRTLLVREIRRYLDNLGFLEVETPTLQSLYGGANAKPFITHINMLDTDMYLRIADELYLKRLVVGGYEKVYEICKDFRNEGLDLTHQPEFTMIEYYEAYADYHRVMDITEGLFKHLGKEVLGSTSIQVGEKTIELGGKWPRVRMVDIISEKLKLDVKKETQETLAKYCKENGIDLVGGESHGQLIFAIFDHKITNQLIDPTWIIDYPKEVSPLSKDKYDEPGFVERFEGYMGGKEICDGWSELTDPQEQRKRFMSDVKAARKDKEEAQQVDENFLEAMEYGMPPIGGIGIGIDRLTMFFTNTWSIKEVILYPLMRPQNRKVSKKKRGEIK